MRQTSQNPDKTMSMLDHLNELRRRFIASLLVFGISFIIALVFYSRLIKLFTDQFANFIAEGFLVQLQTSAIAALIISLPFHLVNICQFIFPALHAKTRTIVSIGLVISFFLSVLGAYIAYFQIIPFSIRFLTISMFIPADVGILLNYQKSITYVLSFMLWTIITFQAPLVLGNPSRSQSSQ
jgi:sec-independent protein translocase protein TatC